MAILPGAVLSGLHGLLRDAREAMPLMALAAQALVAAAVLAGLALLARLSARSLALLRAIGAPRRFVLAVTWSASAALIGLGSGLGLAPGGLAALVLGRIVTARTDVLVNARLGWTEAHPAAGAASLALILALLASRRPVLADLRA